MKLKTRICTVRVVACETGGEWHRESKQRLDSHNPFFTVQELRAFQSSGNYEQMKIMEARNKNTDLNVGGQIDIITKAESV